MVVVVAVMDLPRVSRRTGTCRHGKRACSQPPATLQRKGAPCETEDHEAGGMHFIGH
jgi:hypothetical protein